MLRFDWGDPYDLQVVEGVMAEQPELAWLWSVHCETSTGVLNDLAGLESLCCRRQVKLCADRHTSPAVISIVLPEQVSSLRLGEAMEQQGMLLSYRSSYLLERNIIQICLMGAVGEEQCLQMVDIFVGAAAECKTRVAENS